MGTEHLNPLGSLEISASITNALLIITRFVHDSSRVLTLLLAMWFRTVLLTARGAGCLAHSSACHQLYSACQTTEQPAVSLQVNSLIGGFPQENDKIK